MDPPMFYDPNSWIYYHLPPPPDLVMAMVNQPLNMYSFPPPSYTAPRSVPYANWPSFWPNMGRERQEIGKQTPLHSIPLPAPITECNTQRTLPVTDDSSPPNNGEVTLPKQTPDQNSCESDLRENIDPAVVSSKHSNEIIMKVKDPYENILGEKRNFNREDLHMQIPIKHEPRVRLADKVNCPTETPSQDESASSIENEYTESIRTHVRIKEDPDSALIRQIISEYKSPKKEVPIATVEKRRNADNVKILVKQEPIGQDETSAVAQHSNREITSRQASFSPSSKSKNTSLNVMIRVKQEVVELNKFEGHQSVNHCVVEPNLGAALPQQDCEDEERLVIVESPKEEQTQQSSTKTSSRISVDCSSAKDRSSDTNSVCSTSSSFPERDHMEINTDTKDYDHVSEMQSTNSIRPETDQTKENGFVEYRELFSDLTLPPLDLARTRNATKKRTSRPTQQNDPYIVTKKFCTAPSPEKRPIGLDNMMVSDDDTVEEMNDQFDIKQSVRRDSAGAHIFDKHDDYGQCASSPAQADDDDVELLYDKDDHMASMAIRYHKKTPTVNEAPPPFQNNSKGEKVTFVANEDGIFRQKQRMNVNGQVTKMDMNLIQVYKPTLSLTISPEDGWTDAAEKVAFGDWMKHKMEKHAIRKTAERYCELCPAWKTNPSYRSLISGSFAPIPHQKWREYKFQFTFRDGATAIRRIRIGLPKETLASIVFNPQKVLEPIGGWLNKEELKRFQRWMEREVGRKDKQ